MITPSGEARRVSDGVKNIRFFGEICCSRTIFARLFKVEIVLWYSISRGDRVPSCRHRSGGVGQFLAGMQFSTKVLKCVVIC